MTDEAQPAPDVPWLLLDTDLGGDIDDLGAMAVLNALADRGKCRIAGVVSDTGRAPSINAIRTVNRWYGRPEIPVGRPEELGPADSYAAAVAALYPDLPGPETAPVLPGAYRQMLADCPDGSVVIATIGFLGRLRDLLISEPDAISPLGGVELVRRKVRRVVTMGGTNPGGTPVRGTDPNFEVGTDERVTQTVVRTCPVPMAFVGNELGNRRLGFGTGARLNELPEDHPVRVGYLHFFNHPPHWVKDGPWDDIQPWSIWDQITVYYAATEDAERFGEVRGTNEIDAMSRNVFSESPDGPHVYLVPRVAPEAIGDGLIEPLMMTRPRPATPGEV